MLEITCQDAEVKVVTLDELPGVHVIRAMAGEIVVNIPLTAYALAALLVDAASSQLN